MVPLAGIEPALLAELDFESSASTNSATGAFRSARRTAEVAKPAEYSGPRLLVNPRRVDARGGRLNAPSSIPGHSSVIELASTDLGARDRTLTRAGEMT